MKYYLVIGGFLGCFLAFSSSLMAGNEIGFSLRNGAIGCLIGAILMSLEKAKQAYDRSVANQEQIHGTTNGKK